MNKVFITITFFCLLISAGCDKILEVEPVSSITNANYWKTEGDVTAYLTGTYSDFRRLMNSTYHLEDRADSFVVGLESGVTDAWLQNLTPSNAPNWTDFYNIVHHCNLMLKFGNDIVFSNQANKDRTMAQIYFIRAHIYFTLTRAWGDVPIVLEPTTENDNQPKPARAPAADVIQLILTDIEQAIALFPESGFVNKSRASKPAAYALKADALLWKFKVQQGSDADLEGVLDAVSKAETGLSLEANFADIFATDKKKGKEIVFSLPFIRDEKSDHYSSRLKPRDIFVTGATNKADVPFAKNGARSVYAPSPKLEAAFNVNASDKRKSVSIVKALGPGGTIIGVFDNKMRGTSYTDDRFFENDIVIYRLAELILFKAEALAALKRPLDAITELNKVRARAGTGNYAGPTDQSSVEKEILNERFRELYLELKRWPDLVRFHYGGTIDAHSEVPNMTATMPLFFPIPKAQIDINPNLLQTDGYE